MHRARGLYRCRDVLRWQSCPSSSPSGSECEAAEKAGLRRRRLCDRRAASHKSGRIATAAAFAGAARSRSPVRRSRGAGACRGLARRRGRCWPAPSATRSPSRLSDRDRAGLPRRRHPRPSRGSRAGGWYRGWRWAAMPHRAGRGPRGLGIEIEAEMARLAAANFVANGRQALVVREADLLADRSRRRQLRSRHGESTLA